MLTDKFYLSFFSFFLYILLFIFVSYYKHGLELFRFQCLPSLKKTETHSTLFLKLFIKLFHEHLISYLNKNIYYGTPFRKIYFIYHFT